MLVVHSNPVPFEQWGMSPWRVERHAHGNVEEGIADKCILPIDRHYRLRLRHDQIVIAEVPVEEHGRMLSAPGNIAKGAQNIFGFRTIDQTAISALSYVCFAAP